MSTPNSYIDLKERTTLALSFMAYEESKAMLEQSLQWLAPLIGQCAIVWGPAFHYNLVHKTDGMAYIVTNQQNPHEYYVTFRGTTPLTLTDWIFHDLLVGYMVDWEKVPFEGLRPPPSPPPGAPAISWATNNAMDIAINVLKDNGIDICDFLQQQARQSDEPVTIYLTGHSLGGVLAPTFALHLAEQWPKNLNKPLVKVYGYAGPTAGNKQFAAYSNQLLGADCKVFQNQLDVATHVWNVKTMEELPSLYSPIQMPPALNKILTKIAIPAVKEKNYTPLQGVQTAIPSKIAEFWFLNEYVIQMIYQHLVPYLAEFIRLCPDNLREQVINLMESWEIVTTLKEIRPLSNDVDKDLRYYIGLLI